MVLTKLSAYFVMSQNLARKSKMSCLVSDVSKRFKDLLPKWLETSLRKKVVVSQDLGSSI